MFAFTGSPYRWPTQPLACGETRDWRLLAALLLVAAGTLLKRGCVTLWRKTAPVCATISQIVAKTVTAAVRAYREARCGAMFVADAATMLGEAIVEYREALWVFITGPFWQFVGWVALAGLTAGFTVITFFGIALSWVAEKVDQAFWYLVEGPLPEAGRWCADAAAIVLPWTISQICRGVCGLIRFAGLLIIPVGGWLGGVAWPKAVKLSASAKAALAAELPRLGHAATALARRAGVAAVVLLGAAAVAAIHAAVSLGVLAGWLMKRGFAHLAEATRYPGAFDPRRARGKGAIRG